MQDTLERREPLEGLAARAGLSARLARWRDLTEIWDEVRHAGLTDADLSAFAVRLAKSANTRDEIRREKDRCRRAETRRGWWLRRLAHATEDRRRNRRAVHVRPLRLRPRRRGAGRPRAQASRSSARSGSSGSDDSGSDGPGPAGPPLAARQTGARYTFAQLTASERGAEVSR